MAHDECEMGDPRETACSSTQRDLHRPERRRTEQADVRKLTLISFVLLGLGLALWAGYAVQGSHVDEDGVLQEPFHLLALGWLFILTGGVALLVALVAGVIKNRRTPK